ncbi:MAG: PQQ-binding-like beta-propeller repeat protein [Sphingobacterium sp.]|nr:PQQ-binding-like beta-propeller repeat protein [Sphingobacterium sp.]
MLATYLTEIKAQDWPQWRGPNRDGVSKEKGLNLDWKVKKPQLLWTFSDAGAGYSAPAIVGSTLYSQGAADGSDFAFALDTRTGKLKWKQKLGPEFIMDRGNGSRGSVTVDGDKLYLVRGGGQIHCLSAADGKMIWQKDFRTDLGGKHYVTD